MERITFFKSYWDAIKLCPDDVQLEIFRSIFRYAFDNEVPIFENKVAEAIWKLILPIINNSIKQANNGLKPKKKKDTSMTDALEHEKKPMTDVLEVQDAEIAENSRLPMEKKSVIDYTKIAEMWNKTCGNLLGKVSKLNDSRRNKIRIRAEEFAKDGCDYLDSFQQLFNLITCSPFLLGENDRGWKASFDWIILNDNNYLKVIEGRYTNTNNTNYGSRHLSERATEECFFADQSKRATELLLQDECDRIVGEIQND